MIRSCSQCNHLIVQNANVLARAPRVAVCGSADRPAGHGSYDVEDWAFVRREGAPRWCPGPSKMPRRMVD